MYIFVHPSTYFSISHFRHGEDMIVTPFAQILASLRSVRQSYIQLTNVPAPRFVIQNWYQSRSGKTSAQSAKLCSDFVKYFGALMHFNYWKYLSKTNFQNEVLHKSFKSQVLLQFLFWLKHHVDVWYLEILILAYYYYWLLLRSTLRHIHWYFWKW